MDRHPSMTERNSSVRAATLNAPHAVVMRAELRGILKTCEQMAPQSVLPMLDEFVDFVSHIVRKQGGEVYGADPNSVTVGFGLREAKAIASSGHEGGDSEAGYWRVMELSQAARRAAVVP